jgi:multidrug resistance efflux pump
VEELARAEAATKEARAQLLASESKNDRQLRESYEQAKSQRSQAKDQFDLIAVNYERAKEGKAKGVMGAVDFDRVETRYRTLQAELAQAEAAERIAAEELQRGSASLEATRQALAAAEAAERSARTKVNTLIKSKDKSGRDLVSPEEREVMAQLEKARWDLDQTTVRAPTEGYVPQVVLRPGTMATATRLVPLMMFVAEERPTLVATYPQKVISDIKPGLHGEAVFKQYPGRSFKVKVRRVLTAVREGEVDASGQLLTATPADAPGYIPVVFDYDEDVAGLNLPVGAQASVAIYTERVHALSILRKIVLRIKSWENYVF